MKVFAQLSPRHTALIACAFAILAFLFIFSIPAAPIIDLIVNIQNRKEQDLRIFHAYRNEYEALAEMALTGQLQHGEQCRAHQAFAVPPSFSESVQYECIFVGGSPTVHVEIMPRSFYRVIVFIEKPERINRVDACGSDGGIIEQLDEHWYYCGRDWN